MNYLFIILKGKVWALNSEGPGVLVLSLMTHRIKDSLFNLLKCFDIFVKKAQYLPHKFVMWIHCI